MSFLVRLVPLRSNVQGIAGQGGSHETNSTLSESRYGNSWKMKSVKREQHVAHDATVNNKIYTHIHTHLMDRNCIYIHVT